MLAIHPVHRRMAELALKARKLGGFDNLSYMEALELEHCFLVNADIVVKLDSLKELALLAHTQEDHEWQHDICKQIEDLETKCI